MSKSKEINEEDVRYYCSEQCAEAGEEYDSEFKWIKLELEVDNDQSSGCGSGVLEGSCGKYASPAIVCHKFIHLLGGGYVPDVGCHHGDVGSGLVGPGFPEVQEECLEESQTGRDCHS